ncbi:MAG: hypothetical protein JRM99_07845 [Nitrososphaerota archaeon]|nr:hypothetical protein [Nitrososphaerota archaeon]MDG6964928.1 hypothetical protein [Nitrososphaerota archaeon]MDG6991312.1 hypothetical protein [Nitrososphaerota archaeon]
MQRRKVESMKVPGETSQTGKATRGSGACLRAAAQAMLVYGGNLEVFNLTDIVTMGYAETTARRAIRALLDWGAVRQAAPHTYLISPEMKAVYLKEAAVSQARARILLFEAFGMERWDERRVDSFLEGFKELWKKRAAEGASDGGTARVSSPPHADC